MKPYATAIVVLDSGSSAAQKIIENGNPIWLFSIAVANTGADTTVDFLFGSTSFTIAAPANDTILTGDVRAQAQSLSVTSVIPVGITITVVYTSDG